MKHEFIKAVTARYREEKIDIPFPIRTIMLPEGEIDEGVSLEKKG